MDESYARDLLAKTRDDYEKIAGDFSSKRRLPNAALGFLFDDYVKKGDSVLDIGCGNGRYCPSFKERGAGYTGIDNSGTFIGIAKKLNPEETFIEADALDLPFAGNSFDKVFSLAALHHIPSRVLRKKFFEETKRVLKPGGILVITVWDIRFATMVKQLKGTRLALFARSKLATLFGGAPLELSDFFIPWAGDCARFVHAFSVGELKGLALSQDMEILASGALKNRKGGEGNLYITARK